MVNHFCLDYALEYFASSSEVVNVGGLINVFVDCVDVDSSMG